ncbi:MAG: M48 family metalloprotease [Actinomycetota bacterium]|nr:M48 family metalloprotease [Actinomycetota bacterium]
MRSARSLYRLNLALAGLGALVVLAGTAVALGRVDLAPGPVGRMLSDCSRLLLPAVKPGGLAVLGLALLGVVAVARGLRSAVCQIGGSRRILRALEILGERQMHRSLVVLIAGSRPQAFCAGFARPRVYLSCASLDLLSEAQLAAVVAHEVQHVRRRDPLRLLLLNTLADALFFLPALRRLKTRYAALAELAADEAALAAVGDPSHLAAALLQFGERGVPGVVGVDPERVDHLLGSPPRWGMPAAVIVGALLTLGALSAFVLAIAASAAGLRTSVGQLAAQSCTVVMTVGPILAFLALGVLGRRTIARSRP